MLVLFADLTCSSSCFASYAMELLRFCEAGFEVIVKARSLKLLFLAIPYKMMIGCSITMVKIVLFQDFRERWARQSLAFYMFRQADRVEKLADIIQRLVVN